MGCITTKAKLETDQPRKPSPQIEDSTKFWDDPQISDANSREQTIASVENIFYYYKFEKRLGSGSFGHVDLAIPLSEPSKRVAIKTIQKETVQNIPQYYLKREVDIMKRLDHPNICKFLEAYMDKDHIYLVMEYCSGGTLKELIYSSLNTEYNVAKIMQKLFWAVNYMHNSNIVHRDLKLENVIFTTKDTATAEIKIIDFGLSKKLLANEKRRHTKVGSFNYMVWFDLGICTCSITAPEVLKHSKNDKECDVWSLGCILFALICGELPFYDVKSISQGMCQFDAPSWKLASKDARNLVEQMLIVSSEKRITLAAAMNHSWFARLRKNTLGTIALPRQQQQRGSKQLVLDRFLSFKHSTMFKRIVLQLIVRQMESAESMTPQDIFALFDKNSNGFISLEDLKQVIQKLKFDGEEQFKEDSQIEELFNTITKKESQNKNINNMVLEEKDGKSQIDQENKEVSEIEQKKKINYSEFLAATLDDQYYLQIERLKKTFNYLDASETGTISQNDLIDILAREGRKLPLEDIQAIYAEISQFLNYSTGELNFQGFQEIMKQGTIIGNLEQVNEEGENNSSIVSSSSSSSNSSHESDSQKEQMGKNDKEDENNNNQRSA